MKGLLFLPGAEGGADHGRKALGFHIGHHLRERGGSPAVKLALCRLCGLHGKIPGKGVVLVHQAKVPGKRLRQRGLFLAGLGGGCFQVHTWLSVFRGAVGACGRGRGRGCGFPAGCRGSQPRAEEHESQHTGCSGQARQQVVKSAVFSGRGAGQAGVPVGSWAFPPFGFCNTDGGEGWDSYKILPFPRAALSIRRME